MIAYSFLLANSADITIADLFRDISDFMHAFAFRRKPHLAELRKPDSDMQCPIDLTPMQSQPQVP